MIQSGKASPGRRRASKTPETRISGKMDKEWKIRRSGEFSISYTSQNAWTILMSPGNSRIWHLKTPIWIFWCLRVPTTLFHNVISKWCSRGKHGCEWGWLIHHFPKIHEWTFGPKNLWLSIAFEEQKSLNSKHFFLSSRTHMDQALLALCPSSIHGIIQSFSLTILMPIH